MSTGEGKTVWKFCARIPVSDDEDETREQDVMDNPLRATEAATEAAASQTTRSKGRNKEKKRRPDTIDVQYTNTGAMDIVFASDDDTGKCWIKDVTSSRLRPGMRLVSMEIMDTKTQKMVTRSLTNVPFVEVIRELETQTSIGQQGITPYHMKFEPDLDDTAVSRLSSSKFFRFESKHNKEVIDAIEAIDRGTERSAALGVYKSEELEQLRAELALNHAKRKSLQHRVAALQRERESTEQQHEEKLRRVMALETEEAAAVEECRSQIREMEANYAKVSQDLKSLQSNNEELGQRFATQSGQLEAARKREVQAHESQEQLAKQLMDTLDQVQDEESLLEKAEGKSAEREDQVRNLMQQIETLKEQKASDDMDLEQMTVRAREADAAAREAGEREETDRIEFKAHSQKLNATITALNAKSDRQQENQKVEQAAAAERISALEEGKRRLESSLEQFETKYNVLQAQHSEVQMALSLSTKEVQGLKKQREDIQAALAEQLKLQEAEHTKAEKNAAAIRKQLEKDAADLEKQQKLAARDLRLAHDVEKFNELKLNASMTGKIKQITALEQQVSELQKQLELEKQARVEHESEVARLNAGVVSEAKENADLKIESEFLKTTIASKVDQLKQCNTAKMQLESTIVDLKAQMQERTDALQVELDDERLRANESTEMRVEVETKLQTAKKELLQVRRNLDDLKAQHNTSLVQITTLQRRAQSQNTATKMVSALARDKLANVTELHAVDAVEIEKLKDDYKTLRAAAETNARELEKTRHELDSTHQRVVELTQEASDSKTTSEKAISELQAALATAQSTEKDVSARLATMGQQLTLVTSQHKSASLAAQSTSFKLTEAKAAAVQAANELKEARGRITELDTVQQQTKTDVQVYLQELQGLGQEVKTEKAARKSCEEQLRASKSALIEGKGLSEILRTELAQAKTQLSVALTVQPKLDETTRKLEKAEEQLANLKESTTASAAADVAAANKTSDDLLAKAHAEAQKLSEQLASAKSAAADANNTIAARDTELKGQAAKAALDAADAEKALKDAEAERQKTIAEFEEKIGVLEEAVQSVQQRLNTSEAELASTTGMLQAETEAKDRLQETIDENAEKYASEVESHNETKDMSKSQLEDARLTIDRYAKEAVAHQAERDKLQDKISDIERERMRIYARLAETQMVLLSKSKALVDSTTQAKRYRAMSTMKIGILKGVQAQLQDSAESTDQNTERLQQQLAQTQAEAVQSAQELEEDRTRIDGELRETAEALSQAQRVAEDRAKTIKTLQTKLDSNTVQLKQYESDVKDLEEQCTLWRAKVRHRHRALEVPHFAKSKTGQKEKEEWMKEKALDDSLGFDDTLNREITVTFDGTSAFEREHNGALGLGLLTCQDHDKITRTLIHRMTEGSTADMCPNLVNGQVLMAINGEKLQGLTVAEVCEKLKTAPRPVSLVLRPGSMELKLLAYDDTKHIVAGKKGKKQKKKS